MTLKERLLDLISCEKLNPNQFYVKTGLGNGFLDKVGEKLKNPSIEKISNVFPHWNIDYLQTGDGEKYNKQNNQTINDVQNSPMTAVNFQGNHNDFMCDREIIMNSFNGYQRMIAKQQEQMDNLISIINRIIESKDEK